jgi:group I intron endonuclease
MTFHVFDLGSPLYVEPDQVREFLFSIAKAGYVAGVYLCRASGLSIVIDAGRINKTNGKMYVGSSVNLYARIAGYICFNKLHGIIGDALLKYGLSSFVLVIFLVPDASSALVLSLEQSILDNCVCAYNILPTAGSYSGFKLTDETKAKISASKKGQKHSDETKMKMSATKKRRVTEEMRAKVSAIQKGKGNSNYNNGKPCHLIQVSPSGLNLVLSFPNQNRCAEALGVHMQTVIYRLKNKVVFRYNGCDHFLTSSLPSNLLP